MTEDGMTPQGRALLEELRAAAGDRPAHARWVDLCIAAELADEAGDADALPITSTPALPREVAEEIADAVAWIAHRERAIRDGRSPAPALYPRDYLDRRERGPVRRTRPAAAPAPRRRTAVSGYQYRPH
ncbi:hypothetical protein [Bailinhaonella thermotolerans]|uniref:Uncharacterized protein n=1 Tax=Bailinhaonella thermotolerans TaxID=1070861 RepID=A0A3A3ZZD2_9ACTN|nr:hypothetical protein [Bailinhaonella thermotolerans]RJL19721.1 hypothetical protein D5H75_40050 [Bailinhaonella thermotolerans]